MTINPVSYTQFARIRTSGIAPVAQPAAVPQNNSRQDLQTARTELLAVYASLQELARLMDVPSNFRLDLPDARSNPALNLDLTTTAATLASADEINASPTSYTPFGPDWTSGSSALLTVDGEYDGAQGSGNLTFEVRRAGVRGSDNLRIRVYDPSGGTMSQFNVRRNDPLDLQYALGNGLFVTVGAGFLVNRDTASLAVSSTVGSVFDPDLPFDGVRNTNPNLQFYPAQGARPTVADGAFLLNGESIAVNAADTLNDVIARINQSAAGVIASYDAAAERLRLEQATPGSVPTIDASGDTSGLLAAIKLAGAVVVPGTDPEPDRPLADVAAFSGVQDGQLLINGTAIAIDTANDSLNEVLQSINDSDAGATAIFDSALQQVVITSSDGVSPLTLTDNGTGLLGALNLPAGRLDPQALNDGISRRRAYAIADEFEAAFRSLNRLFSDGRFVDGADHTGIFRNALAGAVGAEFGAPDGLFGVAFDSSSGARTNGRFADFDRADFTRAVQRRGSDVRRALAGGRSDDGLIAELGAATVIALRNVSSALGLKGSIVDVFA